MTDEIARRAEDFLESPHSDLDTPGALARQDALPVQPQWLLTGVEAGKGVMVLAAAPLEVVKFERVAAGVDLVPIGKGTARIPRVVWTLSARFQNPTSIMGENYADALASVSRVWSPPGG